jgi:cytochrome c biogenesis protein CcmG, thiol:disulfide interchange protein DsbE
MAILRFAAPTLYLLLASFLVAACDPITAPPASPESYRENRQVFLPAPEFAVVTDNSGTFSLAHNLGKPVVLYFWGSSASVCMSDLLAFQDLINRYRTQDVQVLALSIWDTTAAAEEIFRAHSFTFPTTGQNEIVMQAYDVSSCPTTIFIDRQGVIRVIHIGPATEEEFDRSMALILP